MRAVRVFFLQRRVVPLLIVILFKENNFTNDKQSGKSYLIFYSILVSNACAAELKI